jgi:TonB family protein
MQQQNNHIKPVADPELIRRYLAGELDHKAMHALERQALDDPFLAEALDGFEQHAPDQRVHLADLSKRLAQRVQPAQKKVIPIYLRWVAAAAVCVVIGSSIIWLWPVHNQSEIAKVTVKTDTIIPGEVSGMVLVPESATMFKKNQDNRKPYRSPVLPAPMVSPAPVATPPPQAEVAAAEPAPKAEMLLTDTSRIIASQNFYKSFDTDDAAVSSLGLKRAAAVSAIDQGQIKGRILNVHGDSGIANVTVSMGAVGTTTDEEGYFALPANEPLLSRKKISSKQQLLTAYAPGYKTISQTYKGDAFVRMQLRRTSDTSTTVVNNSNEPSPMGGFDKFELYLAKNVQYPTGLSVSGSVRVQFYVQQDGSLTDFRVLKKLQPECDQEAIRVIKSGPAWLPAANGKAVRVKVDVKFSPEAH